MQSYEFGNVSVDNAFARFGSKSFAINKITSVDVRSNTKPPSSAFLVFWVLAVVFALYALRLAPSDAIMPVVLAIGLGLAGWWAFKNKRAITTYRLFLHTAGSEAQAYETTDQREITTLRNALEAAMAASA